jgi:sRNA-binding protein
MTKLLIYAAAALAIVSAIGAYIHGAKESAREEVRAEWRASSIAAAEESRRQVERVKAEAQRQREQEQRERDQKAESERTRLKAEADNYAAKSKDLQKRFEHELSVNSDCAAQMNQVLLCPIE